MIVYNRKCKTMNNEMVISVFGTTITTSLITKLQLCHVHDESFYEFMKTVRRTSSCDQKYGWYTKSTLESMKKLITRIIIDRYYYFHDYHDYHYYYY